MDAVVEAVVGIIRKRRQLCLDSMAAGNADDYAAYKLMVGQIYALDILEDDVKELNKKMEEDG